MCLWFKKKIKKSSQPTNICLSFFPVDPNFYSKNLLMLGKTYLAMKDKEKALLWLTKTKEYPAHTLEDKEVHTPWLQTYDLLCFCIFQFNCISVELFNLISACSSSSAGPQGSCGSPEEAGMKLGETWRPSGPLTAANKTVS